jgi:hypothetical protein
VEGKEVVVSTVYDGEWKDDEKNGRGSLTITTNFLDILAPSSSSSSGDSSSAGNSEISSLQQKQVIHKYEGQFKRDQQCGEGILTVTRVSDGKSILVSRYAGQWDLSVRSGKGKQSVFSTDDGTLQSEYEGEWKNDKVSSCVEKGKPSYLCFLIRNTVLAKNLPSLITTELPTRVSGLKI